MNFLGNLSPADFLKQYWQKKPLLIKQSFPNYQSPITAEELAGLACEEGIESRLIQERVKDNSWQLQHGPFQEHDFTSLPKSHWSLLVQAVNHHIPALNQLLDEFNFVPVWRVDDIMVSYAPVNGSVGPHLDNYDVFLLQVQGRRHWHINEHDYTEDDFLDELELKILADFKAEQDWILEPGDMLYLPPGVAHHGIALDDCMTFSVGFRAPSKKELLSAYTVNFNDVAKDQFYTDQDLQLQDSSGEIKTEHIRSMREMILSAVSDDAEFASWFGRFITEDMNHYETEQNELDNDAFKKQFKQNGYLNRYGNIRFSYIEDHENLKFFYAGNELQLALEQLSLIQYLSSQHRLDYIETLKFGNEESALDLIHKLYNAGCFYFDE
jgi:50S ribosomal protein L16 3-hydroxylase